MQVALGAVLLIAVLWFVALRPKPSSSGGSAAPSAAPTQAAPTAPGVSGLKPSGGAATSSTAAHHTSATSTGTAAHRATPKHAAAGSTAKADPHVRLLRSALRQHKAIAVAFVAPQAADSRAVAAEIRHVSHFHGRAVVLSIPLSQLSRYGFITRGVDVTVAPTTLIVDRKHDATTIVGFADRFEIQQRLADALAVKRS